MAEKYCVQLKDEPAIRDFIGAEAAGTALQEGTDGENTSVSDNGKAEALLKELAEVKEWAAPVKRGRFTYDDKKFFTSVKKQFDEGKLLSAKQLAALEKMAERYRKKD